MEPCPRPCSSTHDAFCSFKENRENIRPGSSGFSPPTKWPRATTPRRRDSLEMTSSINTSVLSASATDDSGFHDSSMHSPPLRKTKVLVPILRTPTSSMARSTSSMITPSPRSRMSLHHSTSSPVLTTSRPLRLSNPHNSIGISIQASGDKQSELTVIRRVNRCLENQYPENQFAEEANVMLSGLTTPQRLRDGSPESSSYKINVETPSKYLEPDDSGLFSFASISDTPPRRNLSLAGFSSLSSIHRIPELTSGPLEHGVFESVGDLIPLPMEILSPERLRPSPPKPIARRVSASSAMLPTKTPTGTLTSIPAPISRSASALVTCTPSSALTKNIGKPIFQSTPITVETNAVAPEVQQKAEAPIIRCTPVTSAPGKAKRRRESDEGNSNSFLTPKKPLKPFGRRWLRIVYGTTTAQREMTAAAHEFLRQARERRAAQDVEAF